MCKGFLKVPRTVIAQLLERRGKSAFTEAEAYLDILQNIHYGTGTKTSVVGRRKVQVQRGEWAVSERLLAERWGWNNIRVHRFLTNTVDEYEIYVYKRDNQSIVSINENYEADYIADTVAVSSTDNPNDKQGIIDFYEAESETTTEQKVKHPIYIEEKKKRKYKQVYIKEKTQNSESFNRFLDFMLDQAPNVYRHFLGKDASLLSPEQLERLKEDFTPEVVADTILQLENRPDLMKRYRSLNLTLRNWCKKNKPL